MQSQYQFELTVVGNDSKFLKTIGDYEINHYFYKKPAVPAHLKRALSPTHTQYVVQNNYCFWRALINFFRPIPVMTQQITLTVPELMSAINARILSGPKQIQEKEMEKVCKFFKIDLVRDLSNIGKRGAIHCFQYKYQGTMYGHTSFIHTRNSTVKPLVELFDYLYSKQSPFEPIEELPILKVQQEIKQLPIQEQKPQEQKPKGSNNKSSSKKPIKNKKKYVSKSAPKKASQEQEKKPSIKNVEEKKKKQTHNHIKRQIEHYSQQTRQGILGKVFTLIRLAAKNGQDLPKLTDNLEEERNWAFFNWEFKSGVQKFYKVPKKISSLQSLYIASAINKSTFPTVWTKTRQELVDIYDRSYVQKKQNLKVGSNIFAFLNPQLKIEENKWAPKLDLQFSKLAYDSGIIQKFTKFEKFLKALQMPRLDLNFVAPQLRKDMIGQTIISTPYTGIANDAVNRTLNKLLTNTQPLFKQQVQFQLRVLSDVAKQDLGLASKATCQYLDHIKKSVANIQLPILTPHRPYASVALGNDSLGSQPFARYFNENSPFESQAVSSQVMYRPLRLQEKISLQSQMLRRQLVQATEQTKLATRGAFQYVTETVSEAPKKFQQQVRKIHQTFYQKFFQTLKNIQDRTVNKIKAGITSTRNAFGAKYHQCSTRLSNCYNKAKFRTYATLGVAATALAFSLIMGSFKYQGCTLYHPMMVPFAPSQEAPINLIVAMHCVSAQPLVAEGNVKKKGIHVKNGKFIYKPTGALNGDYVKFIQSHGIQIDRVALSEAGGNSGGHPNIRCGADLVCVRNLNIMLNRIKQETKLGNTVRIVDVGAKFGKIFGLFEQVLTPTFDDIYPYREAGLMNDAAKARYKFIRGQIRARFDHWWKNRPAGLTQLQAHVQILALYNLPINDHQGVPVTLATFEAPPRTDPLIAGHVVLIPNQKLVQYYPVRPIDTDYNRTYYMQNLAPYRAQIAKAVNVLGFEPHQQTIQHWQTHVLPTLTYPFRVVGPRLKAFHLYFMNDVHYYLQGWQSKSEAAGFESEAYVSGGLFSKFPGTYLLPAGDGTYTISGHGQRTKVVMHTRTAGQDYSHDLVTVSSTDFRLDYGWYSHFSVAIPLGKLAIKKVELPLLDATARRLTNVKNLQATFCLQKLNSKDFKDSAMFKNKRDQLFMHAAYTPQQLLLVMKSFCKMQGLNRNQVQQLIQFTAGYQSVKISPRISVGLSVPFFYRKQLFSFQEPFAEYRGLVHQLDGNSKRPVRMNWRGLQQQGEYHQYDEHERVRVRYGQNKFQQAFTRLAQDYSPNLFADYTHGALCDQNHLKQGTTLQQDEDDDKPPQKQLSTPHLLQRWFQITNVPPTRQQLRGIHEIMLQGKPRKNLKSLALTTQNVTTAPCQFHTKPTPPCLPRMQTNTLDVADGNLEVQRVNQWLQKHPKPVMWDAKLNRLVPYEQYGVRTKTGLDLVDGRLDFQWSAKSKHNAVYALHHRHLAPRIRPARNALNRFKDMTQRYFKNFKQKWKSVKLPIFDPIEYINSKTEFPKAKKLHYIQTLTKQLIQPSVKNWNGSYLSMVKSGQNYYTPDLKVLNGFLTKQSSRPRQICNPSSILCGVLTTYQSLLWTPIKRAQTGFVQGLDKKTMQDLFRSYARQNWITFSLDGSGFDSTQFTAILKLVDDKFWQIVMPSLQQCYARSQAVHPHLQLSPQLFSAQFLAAVLNHTSVIFTHLGQLKHRVWPQRIWKAWMKDMAHSQPSGTDRFYVQSNYTYTQVSGTTFSGHPTKTTLGNTLRSLMYAYFYLQDAGIYEPWKSFQCKVFASGDDVVIFIDPRYKARLTTSIRRFAASEDGDMQYGLGQIIKKVIVRDCFDFEFCSKWAYSPSGKGADLHFCRDALKTLSTRQYYSKQNKQLLNKPHLHALAIYQSFKSQKASRLIQQILLFRVKMYAPKDFQLTGVDPKLLSLLSNKHKFAFSDQKSQGGYQMEEYINSRCGIGIHTLMQLMQNHTLDCASNPDFALQRRYFGCNVFTQVLEKKSVKTKPKLSKARYLAVSSSKNPVNSLPMSPGTIPQALSQNSFQEQDSHSG